MDLAGSWRRQVAPGSPCTYRGIKNTPQTRWTLRLDGPAGLFNRLDEVRISLGEPKTDERPLADARTLHRERKFTAWRERTARRSSHWHAAGVVKAKANLPLLEVLADGSVYASGDQTKSDTYDLSLKTTLAKITAIRLEALPDDRLPKNGPGMTYYEGPFGDFFLTNSP